MYSESNNIRIDSKRRQVISPGGNRGAQGGFQPFKHRKQGLFGSQGTQGTKIRKILQKLKKIRKRRGLLLDRFSVSYPYKQNSRQP